VRPHLRPTTRLRCDPDSNKERKRARPRVPSSRNCHLIGNLEAAPVENGELRAKTAFLVYRSHLETDHHVLSGCREDLLCKVNGARKAGAPYQICHGRRDCCLENGSGSVGNRRFESCSLQQRVRLSPASALEG
jgi:Ring hydroxylating beta subunit